MELYQEGRFFTNIDFDSQYASCKIVKDWPRFSSLCQ